MTVLLALQAAEATAVLGTRMALGDRRTARLLFSQPYDAGFCSRHTHQLAGLLMALSDVEAEGGEQA